MTTTLLEYYFLLLGLVFILVDTKASLSVVPNGEIKLHLYNIQYDTDKYPFLYDEQLTLEDLHFAEVIHYFPNGRKKSTSNYNE